MTNAGEYARYMRQISISVKGKETETLFASPQGKTFFDALYQLDKRQRGTSYHLDKSNTEYSSYTAVLPNHSVLCRRGLSNQCSNNKWAGMDTLSGTCIAQCVAWYDSFERSLVNFHFLFNVSKSSINKLSKNKKHASR